MKKTLFALVMGIVMIGLASCGGNKHSKAFNESKRILDNIYESIDKAETCDDLDTAFVAIIDLLSVEGIDAIPETEHQELTTIAEKIDELMESKRADFGCQDDELIDNDDIPFDEEVEEELE